MPKWIGVIFSSSSAKIRHHLSSLCRCIVFFLCVYSTITAAGFCLSGLLFRIYSRSSLSVSKWNFKFCEFIGAGLFTCSSCRPTNSIKALKGRYNTNNEIINKTELNKSVNIKYYYYYVAVMYYYLLICLILFCLWSCYEHRINVVTLIAYMHFLFFSLSVSIRRWTYF